MRGSLHIGWASMTCYCCSNTDATQDIFPGNFLCNYYEGDGFDTYGCLAAGQHVKPFRSLFPFKVYLIDFERAICFEPGSDPNTHLVSGIPSRHDNADESTYQRPVAPEMLGEMPYNAFAADIWQLGTYLSMLGQVSLESFQRFLADAVQSNKLPAAVGKLIDQMTAETPSERPTAREALLRLRRIKSELTLDELNAPVYIGPAAPTGPPPELMDEVTPEFAAHVA